MERIGNNDPAALEVDSDRNEDEGREALLDDAFDSWYRGIGRRAEARLDMTEVPRESALDAADPDSEREWVVGCDDQAR